MSAAFEPSSNWPGPSSLLNGCRMSGGSSQTRSPKATGAVFVLSGIEPQALDRRFRSNTLLSLAKQHRSRHRFRSAQDLHRHPVAGLLAAQRVSEIVKVADRLPVEFYQNVARLKPCLGCRRAVADIGEPHAVGDLGEIRNTTELWTVTRLRRAHRGPAMRRLRLLHPHEQRPLGLLTQRGSDRRDHIQQL